MFLGIDCSTQSLSAILVDFEKGKIVWNKSLIFEKTFPEYQTTSGALRFKDSLVVHSPPLMWVEALDRLFEEMVQEGVDAGAILAIAGSAQQHGSVYLDKSFASRIQSLVPESGLKEQLAGCFSRETSPIWMDASTNVECDEIRDAMNGWEKVALATGSDAFERFTGPQIRKFFKEEPMSYEETDTIALVSSFMSSLLSGKISPIDYGDGSGMNLMDIQKKRWHPKMLDATAPHLEKKLPPLAESWRVVGKIHPYFSRKYGVNPEALSLVWTGDNPASLIGLGLIDEGTIGISVGTSFTYFGALKSFHIDPTGAGNLFVSPTGDYMPLNCFLNGALAIQKIRTEYGLDWEGFDRALAATRPGNDGAILLPYFEPEIIPKVLKAGVGRFDLDPKDSSANCRALIEAQMMSMRLHASWLKMKPTRIYATGGVSNQERILQIMADVHSCSVWKSEVAKSTALGAALIAVYGFFLEQGSKKNWQEVVGKFTKPSGRPVEPHAEAVRVYNKLVEKYADCEKKWINTL